MKMANVAAVLALLTMWLGATAAQAQDGRWLRAETTNFVVYSDKPERVLREAAQELEDLDATLRIITGSTAPAAETKLEVYLLDTRAFQTVFPTASDGIRGIYSSNPEAIGAFAIYADIGYMDRERILYHEYAHHFMMQYFPDAYPAWYIEGFAEYIGNIYFRGREVTVGGPSDRSAHLLARGLLRTRQLISPEGRNEELFYPTSWLATTYILNDRQRQEGLHRYIAALSSGEDPVEAFQPAFGVTPEQFDRALISFGNGRMQRLRFNLPAALPEVSITRMPMVMDDLLLQVARAQFNSDEFEIGDADARAIAADLERYASRFPNYPYAERAMARAALLRDARAGVRTRLSPVIAANPNDVEALYLMAQSHMRDAEQNKENPEAQRASLSEARRLLARGFRADPNHFPTLFLYARANQSATQPMSAEQIGVLERALVLAPHVGEIRITLARELMKAGLFIEAQTALRPAMFSVHDPRQATYARTLMQAARNGEAPPDPPEPDEDDED